VRNRIFFYLSLFGWALLSCGGPSPEGKPAAKARVVPVLQSPLPAQERPLVNPLPQPKAVTALPEKEAPAYIVEGKPDPFKPLNLEWGSLEKQKLAKVLPLQQFELSEFELVGILTTSGTRKALVQDLTGKGYLVQVGTQIGKKGGRISKILSQEVLVEEPYQDYLGRAKIRKVTLKLPQAQLTGYQESVERKDVKKP
jgi:type IV pilus assembly protein PilP